MYVSVRPKPNNKLARGMRTRRLSRGGLHETRTAAPSELPARDQPARAVDNASQSLDLASYSCECGYVFEAQVSTTVDCPHCGAGQAW